MADFDALDGRLRDALGQAAQQGDSAGVADAIRARVAAGDPGTSVASSTAPGWGGGWSWLPWLATVLVAGIVGTTLGLTGVFGVPTEEVSVLPSTASVVEIAPAYSCPGGPQVGQLRGGDRVVAVQRSDDAAYLGVRDPWNVGTVLWVTASAVVVDAGEPAISTLPVGACPEATVQYGDPTPTAEPTEEPGPQPGPPAPQPPGPTPDTTAPSITQYGGSPSQICADPQSGWATSTTVSAVASDNVGVSGVRMTWSQFGGGSAELSLSGGTWRANYDPPSGSQGMITFQLVARDAAGNLSAPRNVAVQVWSVGNCPI
jgi:hypothetical protein